MRGTNAVFLALAAVLPAFADSMHGNSSSDVVAFDEVVVVATKRATSVFVTWPQTSRY